MTIKIKKTDGSWSVVSGGGGGGSVSFASITGQPADNQNLRTALSNKVTKKEGTFEMGKDSDGSYVWSE